MKFNSNPAYEKLGAEEYYGDFQRNERKSTFSKICSSKSFLMGNTLIILLNIWFIFATTNKRISLRSYCPEIPFAPFQHDVTYERRPIDLTSFNPFAGERTPAMDAAWEKLKIYEIWRATEEELDRSHALEDRSLRLQNGGYMAISRAYHEIHCLDWIKREWDPTRPLMTWHLDHCLDALRQGAMCHADLSIGSFYHWPQDHAERERVRRPNYQRRCMNWGSFEDLLHDRKMEFKNGVPEPPLDEYGQPIVVPPTDGLHTLNEELDDF